MTTLALWHDMIQRQDLDRLGDILDPDCVFLSPIVHTPQCGRDLTSLYLNGALGVFNETFHYTKEVVTPEHAVLEFICEVEGISINGVDIMTFNKEGKIAEFKVMLRPLKAVNLMHAQMQAILKKLAG